MPLRAKVLACTMMLMSWTLLVLLGASIWVLVVSGLCLSATASYLVTRPSY